MRIPRRSSWLSPAFGPNTVSASSSSSVGGSALIDRTRAAGLMFTVSSGSWQVASMMSSSLLLPHRLTGLVTSSRGAQFHAGAAWVAAIHNTIASAASGEGSTTYRVSAACTSSRSRAPIGCRHAAPPAVLGSRRAGGRRSAPGRQAPSGAAPARRSSGR